MGYKYQGDVVINASLTVDTPKPLDSRTVVEDLTELYNIPEKSAYQGMTVANINDGNLYMLIDKNKIAEKAGWKASYESIQIITCTQEEYDTWAENTTEDYKPIDGNLVYLRRDVYYYIYEDEDNAQYYVTKKQIEDWLGTKASSVDLDGLRIVVSNNKKDQDALNTTVTDLITNIDTNYINATQIAEIYATIEALNSVDNKFTNYYTSEKINELFVTKESLRGGLEGNDEENFVFVTQSQYDADKDANLEKLTTRALTLLTTQEEGEDVATTIKATEDAIVVESNDITKELAFKEIVPKIEIVETKEAYDNITKKDPETYYYIIDDSILGYITQNEAIGTFYTKGEVNNMIAKAKEDVIQKMLDDYITPLQEKLAALESSQV